MESTDSQSVILRDVSEGDLPIFFEHQLDSVAVAMAAFTTKDPSDREAFSNHWARVLANDSIVKKTIVAQNVVVGHVVQFDRDGDAEITYWLGREHWGQGIATKALALLLTEVEIRPLFARVVKDNVASARVLEKCGFERYGEDEGFANARGKVVEEWIYRLS